ncbi:MAG: phage late control D family protein [Solirubrobacterales bacterium]
MDDITELKSSKHTYTQLADTYGNFLAPAFKIMVDGHDLLREGLVIEHLSVDTSVEKADSFSCVITNVFEPIRRAWLMDQKGNEKKYIEIGKEVEIQMGYKDKLKVIFYGHVTSMRYNATPTEAPQIILGGMDYSFNIMKGQKSRSWSKKKHSDIVKQLAPSNISAKVDDTEVVLNIVEQVRETDYQFLSRLADFHQYEFFFSGKKMYFRKPHQSKTPVVTLEWGKSLFQASVNADLGDQIGAVEVHGWDHIKKEPIKAKNAPVKPLGLLARTGQWFLKKVLGKEVVENFYTQASSAQEAEKMATAIINKRSMQLVLGNAECIGLPEVRAGRYIQFAGLGKLNNVYYITNASHTIDQSGYFTHITIGGNDL